MRFLSLSKLQLTALYFNVIDVNTSAIKINKKTESSEKPKVSCYSKQYDPK